MPQVIIAWRIQDLLQVIQGQEKPPLLLLSQPGEGVGKPVLHGFPVLLIEVMPRRGEVQLHPAVRPVKAGDGGRFGVAPVIAR